MKNNLRLVLIEPNSSGGLIHYAYQLCTALADQGLDVTLVTGKEYELADLPHNFRVNNMLDLWTLFDPELMKNKKLNFLQNTWNKFRWNVRRVRRAILLIRAWMRLTRYLITTHPDIIQFSKINFPFESFFLAQLQRRGLILTQICHEFELRESSDLFSPLILKSYKDIYTHFSILFFHAKENRDRFLTLFPFVPKDHTHLIQHGNSNWLLRFRTPKAETDDFGSRYGLTKGEKIILFFGLLAPSKGLEDLLDAFAIVSKASSTKLLIAGYPTKHFDTDLFRSKISSLQLSSRVLMDTRYIPLDEIEPLMKLATLVVYPYRSSTQSGALQAAYTFGKPVIATAVGGLPEAVDEGRNGYLVSPESPDELADKILTLINNPELANQFGKQSKLLSETRFSWETIAKEIIEVYNNKLGTETKRETA
jgi:glycosyltransferase involved in cell wall biosynthesis